MGDAKRMSTLFVVGCFNIRLWIIQLKPKCLNIGLWAGEDATKPKYWEVFGTVKWRPKATMTMEN